MPRTRPADRLSTIVEAAIDVFTAKGYRRTQMSDVAQAAGVSQGTLYNYVESKEALFYLLIDRALTDAPLPDSSQLPIRTPSQQTIVARMRERVRTALHLPRLEQALAGSRRSVDARTELDGIIRELYDVFADTRRGADLIERSALDVPQFAQLFFVEIRRGLVERYARYLQSRVDRGAIRPVHDVPTTARLILETVVWFARHRHQTPDSQMISDANALETTVDVLVNGLIADPASNIPRRIK